MTKLDKDSKAYIIDLRNNPGGLFEQYGHFRYVLK